MTRYKRYSIYKPSGVEWLGEVPEHWQVWKVSHAFAQIGSGTTPNTKDLRFYGGDIPWVTTSELRENTITDTSEKLTQDALKEHSALSLYPPGTLLIAMYGATIGRLGILGITACTNQACCALAKPKHLDTKFCFYWLWMRRKEIILLSSGGGQPNLNQQKIYSIRIPAPPIQEQKLIAHFLDRETARIDTLITKKRELIDLLQKKRSAIITDTVTKGLNLDVPLKDSGISWIGKVPQHWNVMRLKFVMSQIVDCLHSTPTYDENGEYLAIRTADISPGILNLQKARRVSTEDYLERIDRLKPQAEDIIYSREGERFGMAALVPPDVDLCLAQRVMMFRVSIINDPTFIMWALNADCTYHQVKQDTVGATSPRVNIRTITEAWLPVPPTNEQHKIGQLISNSCLVIDKVINVIETHIEVIQKYRQTLITAAVTGKIDVSKELDRGIA